MKRRIAQHLGPALVALLLGAFVVCAQTPEVKLRALDGGLFELAEKRGRVVALAFDATWIPKAEQRLPALQKLADQFAGRAVEFYWVSLDSADPQSFNHAAADELREFAARHELRLPILRDADLKAFQAFGVDSAPTLILLRQDGQVHSKHPNFSPDRFDTAQEITRLLKLLTK